MDGPEIERLVLAAPEEHRQLAIFHEVAGEQVMADQDDSDIRMFQFVVDPSEPVVAGWDLDVDEGRDMEIELFEVLSQLVAPRRVDRRVAKEDCRLPVALVRHAFTRVRGGRRSRTLRRSRRLRRGGSHRPWHWWRA